MTTTRAGARLSLGVTGPARPGGAHRAHRSPTPWGQLLLGASALALLGWATWLLTMRTVSLARRPALAATQHVEMLAAGTGALVAAWLLLCALAGAIATVSVRWPHSGLHRAAMRLAPTFTLRFYALAAGAGLALTGAGLVTTVASPVTVQAAGIELLSVPGAPTAPETSRQATLASFGADPVTSPAPSQAAADTTGQTSPVPAADTTGQTSPVSPVSPVSTTPAATHVVQAGDSLWKLAKSQLGPGASNADIAAQWPRWFAANKDVIGANPNLIHPGQVLVIPELP